MKETIINQIQKEKEKDVSSSARSQLTTEYAALSSTKLFSIDVATSEVKVDPLR